MAETSSKVSTSAAGTKDSLIWRELLVGPTIPKGYRSVADLAVELGMSCALTRKRVLKAFRAGKLDRLRVDGANYYRPVEVPKPVELPDGLQQQLTDSLVQDAIARMQEAYEKEQEKPFKMPFIRPHYRDTPGLELPLDEQEPCNDLNRVSGRGKYTL